jgi:hypothetical protein
VSGLPQRLAAARARLELGHGGSGVGLTAALLVGVLALELVMIGSYVGALHEPRPRDVPIAVVGPAAITEPVVAALSSSDALDPKPVPDLAAASDAIEDREVYAALVPGSSVDRLLVASAASSAVADVLPPALRRLEPAGRELRVVDAKPLPTDDARGLSPFYVVVGWLLGGYLGATILGLARGGMPRSRRLAVQRLAALAAYAVVSGLLGALVVQQLVGVLEGNTLGLAAAGALVVFATGAVTAALQSLLGVAGTALAILLFVALGNPASGGPLANELLMPGPWSTVGPLLPPGAGTTLVRNVTYFGGADIAGPLLVLSAYVALGVLGVLAVARRRLATTSPGEAEASAGGALGA